MWLTYWCCLLFVAPYLMEGKVLTADRDARSGIFPETSVEELMQQAFETSKTNSVFQEICLGKSNASKVFVAITGSFRDGAAAILTPAQLIAFTELPNGSANPLPIVPEYLTTIVKTMSNMTALLPWHQLCLLVSIEASVKGILYQAFENVVKSDAVAAISNYLDEDLASSQTVLSASSLSTMYCESSQDFRFILADIVSHTFDLQHGERQFWEDFLFNVSPDSIEVITMIVEFLIVMEWKQIAVILPQGLDIHDDKPVIHVKNINIYFSKLKLDDPASTFAYMAQHEITVALYHGEPDGYLETIEMAETNGFTGPGYVWMYLYNTLVFPDDYTYLWRNMTAERAYAIKNALKGSLSIGRYEGERNPPRFPMTSYARDAAAFLMKSLQTYISFKASLLGIHPSEVSITANDRQALADTVSNVSLLGVTGLINFTYDKRRVTKTLVIRNFIANNSVEFNKSNANIVNPWSVEKRAYFTSGTNRLRYVYGNGTEAQHVTIMFSDGTNRIPSYTVQKTYRRKPAISVALHLSSIGILIVSAMCYALFLRLQDRSCVNDNESLVYRDKNVDFEFECRQNKNSNLSALKAQRRVAKVNNALAFISRACFDTDILTPSFLIKAQNLKKLSHPNICMFLGLLSDGITCSIMHEFCSRGSLQKVLTEAKVPLDWTYRLSFALDIAMGMGYLHSKGILHGNLNSTTCVVNYRWNIKITEYDLLYKLCDHQGNERCKKENLNSRRRQKRSKLNCGALFAPEVRMLGAHSSTSADVYSYGCIMKQIAATEDELKMLPTDQLPSFVIADTSFFYIQLMNLCMSSNPAARPHFDFIKLKLQAIAMDHSNLTDADFGVLAVYSKNLEEIIEEALISLENEKQQYKRSMLHYMPKKLFDDLEEGICTPFKTFNNAAVLCIGICDLARIISGDDCPELKEFLSVVQKMIYKISYSHNCHVVQSTPHAWILLCGMALDSCGVYAVHTLVHAAIEVMDTFKLLPELRMAKLHMGMHKGPLVSGMLLVDAPHYTVLGSTLEVALQLMQTCTELDFCGLVCTTEMKLQISWEVKQIVKEATGIDAEYNGNCFLPDGITSVPAFCLDLNNNIASTKIAKIVSLCSNSADDSHNSPNETGKKGQPYNCAMATIVVTDPSGHIKPIQ